MVFVNRNGINFEYNFIFLFNKQEANSNTIEQFVVISRNSPTVFSVFVIIMKCFWLFLSEEWE